MLQAKTWLASMCFAACTLACATTAFGAVNYESFAYSGTALDGQNGGTGWSGGWFTTGTASQNTLSDDSTSLSYPVPFEAPLITPTTSGGRAKTEGTLTNASTSRLLSTTVPLNVDGTTKYASALFRKNRGNGEVTTDNILLEFVDSSANRRWGLGIEGTGDRPWLNANASTQGSLTVNVGDTYFIVAKIVSSAAGSDTAFLKVFGTGYGSQVPFLEPTEWDATQTETTAAVLDRIRIRIDPGNSPGTPGEVDEIRVADSWLEVIGQPAPANVPGDFNGNGVVDAADYVVWRENQGGPGGSASLGDSEPDNDVDAADYDYWRARLGNTSGSGTGLNSGTIPEPTSLVLITIASIGLLARPRHRT